MIDDKDYKKVKEILAYEGGAFGRFRYGGRVYDSMSECVDLAIMDGYFQSCKSIPHSTLISGKYLAIDGVYCIDMKYKDAFIQYLMIMKLKQIWNSIRQSEKYYVYTYIENQKETWIPLILGMLGNGYTLKNVKIADTYIKKYGVPLYDYRRYNLSYILHKLCSKYNCIILKGFNWESREKIIAWVKNYNSHSYKQVDLKYCKPEVSVPLAVFKPDSKTCVLCQYCGLLKEITEEFHNLKNVIVV